MLTKTTADGDTATLVEEPRKTTRAVKPADESRPAKATKPLTIFLDGEFVSEENAKVSVFDHGLLYGDGIFEGIRFYNGRVFRLEQHLERLWDSARSICLEIPMSHGEMTEALLETIRQNDLREGYIRLLVTRGVGNLGLNPEQCKKPSVIIITAHGSERLAVQAVKSGAYDYIAKPFELDDLRLVVKNAFETIKLRRENQALRRRIEIETSQRGALLGNSKPIQNVRAMIEKVADTDATVLVRGESGTGKELVARELHERSTTRSNGAFVAGADQR